MRLYPVVGEVRIGDYKRDQTWALVAIDHGLSDFRFDGQHTFYTLRATLSPPEFTIMSLRSVMRI